MKLTRSEQESQLKAWLTEVDAAFTVAIQHRNASGLVDYIERNCLLEQLDFIMHSVPENNGIERYKQVTWERISAKSGTLVYRKFVAYQNIRFSKHVQAKVGDDFIEDWGVRRFDDKVLVTNIVRYDAWERDI